MNSKNMSGARRPKWLKVRLAGGKEFRTVRGLVVNSQLNTVCRSARCPNIGECWSRSTATFMILGEVCTRNCRFCAVEGGKPLPPDPREPDRVSAAVKKLSLKHAVITSVTRDDLMDGGAGYFVQVIRKIKKPLPGCRVEVLIPDFKGDDAALQKVFDAHPDILNHNLEVVPRLYPMARPRASFQRSLEILKSAKLNGLVSKTGIMIGLGEHKHEIVELFHKLAEMRLDILTIGQYLQPTSRSLPVEKFYLPDEFQELKKIGEQIGIFHVESGPLVRSSYHADQQLENVRVSNSAVNC